MPTLYLSSAEADSRILFPPFPTAEAVGFHLSPLKRLGFVDGIFTQRFRAGLELLMAENL